MSNCWLSIYEFLTFPRLYCSSTTDYSAPWKPHLHVRVCGRSCLLRLAGNGIWRKAATLTVKRNYIAGCVDLPHVCIARGVCVIEGVIAGPIGAGGVGLCDVHRPPRKLAFGDSSAQDERCRAKNAVIRVVKYHRV